MNNEIQRLHFEIKRINQRLDNSQARLQALEKLKLLVESENKPAEPAPELEKTP